MENNTPPFELFAPDRAYRISDFARDPNCPELAKIPNGRSSIYKAINEGKFPAPTKLGPRTSVWFGRQLNCWLEEKYNQSKNAA